MLFKFVILLLFAAIIYSLISGMVFLVRDKGQSKRTVKALTFRIALSLIAFALLFIGYYAGWIQPHGVIPQ
jgi:succinate dehydrogenase/fumarate reductase cytochrome b subunit